MWFLIFIKLRKLKIKKVLYFLKSLLFNIIFKMLSYGKVFSTTFSKVSLLWYFNHCIKYSAQTIYKSIHIFNMNLDY